MRPDDRYDERDDDRYDVGDWEPQDRRDFLDAIAGASDPWHDLDSEGLVAT
jgi:hypothetical protein